MFAAGGDGGECAIRHIGLTVFVATPAYRRAVGVKGAGMGFAGGDGDKRPARRVGLPLVGVAVGALASSDAVGVQAAGMLAAGGYGGIAGGGGQLGNGSRRRRGSGCKRWRRRWRGEAQLGLAPALPSLPSLLP